MIDLQDKCILDTWSIQPLKAINFNSSKDIDEEHIMHKKSDHKEFMPYDNANDIINEHFAIIDWLQRKKKKDDIIL